MWSNTEIYCDNDTVSLCNIPTCIVAKGEIMISAMDETYEVTKLDWIEVLFTNSRIDRRTVPEGLHCYDLRHDDD